MMKTVIGLSALVVFAFAATGCGSGGDLAPEDKDFQKQLADAAAKNKDKAPVKKGTIKKPADPGAAPGPTSGSN
jgi:hypothetical protein